MPEIISRQQWDSTPGRPPADPGPESLVVFHNTPMRVTTPTSTRAEEIEALRIIENHHRKNNGWADIGYNFAGSQTGRIYECRGWPSAGAHAGTRAANFSSIGIALLLNGNDQRPSPALIQSIRDLLQGGVQIGELAPNFEIKGHRDFKATTCPGDLVYGMLDQFDYRTAADIVPPFEPRGEIVSTREKLRRAIALIEEARDDLSVER